jgi:hypothetical protein
MVGGTVTILTQANPLIVATTTTAHVSSHNTRARIRGCWNDENGLKIRHTNYTPSS